MDLYRYTSPGVRDLTAGGSGSTAYFSINNGATNLGTWNNNPSNGDLGDWYPAGPAPGGNDAANDYGSSEVLSTFSTSDITLMQAIGWTVASGPAAPAIASLFFRNSTGMFTEWQSTGNSFSPNVYINGAVDNTWTMATGDFNGDGKTDVLFRNSSGLFTEWQSTGSGFNQTFMWTARSALPSRSPPSAISTATARAI